MRITSDIAGAHPKALEKDFMDDNSSINVVASNLQRASRRWPKKVSPMKVELGKRPKTKSRCTRRTANKKLVFDEKSFYKDENKKSANRMKGKQRKKEIPRKREEQEKMEESDLFSSLNEDEQEEMQMDPGRKFRRKSPSPFTKETNFILRNKKMLEDLRLKKQKAKRDQQRRLNKSRNKYAHVQSKVRKQIPRSRSRNVGEKSTSINMRPSPMKSPVNAENKKRFKSKSSRRVNPKSQKRRRETEEELRRGQSRRKIKERKKEFVERENEGQMQKYATKKQQRANNGQMGQRLKANYADHHTQPRNKRERVSKSPRVYASPIP